LLVVVHGYYHVAMSLPLLASVITLLTCRRLPERYERVNRELFLRSLLVAGKGLSSRGLRVLGLTLQALVALALLFACFTAVSTFLFGFEPRYALLAVTTPLLAALVYYLPRIVLSTWASQRKIGVEVELPYLLVLIRVMASLRLPVHDMLAVIENSVALQASSREVKFARKISTLTSTSFITAMDNVCANHPSERVRELLRRIVAATVTMGDVKEVVERVFENVYSWFESKVAGLTEKFTIIAGSALFAYLFTPVAVVAVAPVIGVGTFPLLVGITLSVQVFVFFLLYGLITSAYPSSLVVKPTKALLLASMASLSVVFAIALYATFSYALEGIGRVSEQLLALLVPATQVPPLVASERALLRVSVYDNFVRMASDALSFAASTGENAASALERHSRKYGKGVVRIAKSVLTGALSDYLRKVVVKAAPTTYHASFIETLIVMLRLGSTPDMMRSFASSYERLSILVSRVRGFARTLEALLVGLSAMVGGFMAFIDRVYIYIAELMRAAGYPGLYPGILAYDPAVHGLLSSLTLVSLMLASLFIGKVRGGSVLYCHRAIVLMTAIYVTSKYLFSAVPI